MSLENVTAQPVDRAITLAAACLEFKFSRTEDITLPTSSRRPRVNNVTIACHKDLENMKEQYLQDLDFTEIMTNLASCYTRCRKAISLPVLPASDDLRLSIRLPQVANKKARRCSPSLCELLSGSPQIRSNAPDVR